MDDNETTHLQKLRGRVVGRLVDTFAFEEESRDRLAPLKRGSMKTQAPPGGHSLVGQGRAYLKEKYHKPGNVYLGLLHRLDRPVSGVLLFARNSKAAARLSEQFRNRQVRKIYWAVVEGVPHPAEGELTDWLLKRPSEITAEVAGPETPGARECRLHYRTLARLRRGTLLEVEPETGRRHQIRAQFASRGLPIVGDAKYGAKTGLVRGPANRRLYAPIALHARSLTFLHPIRYEPLTVTAPLPAIWRRLGTDLPD
jgi:23S rRNA pseudouridine1911/1915/1917 synthase